jgi:DNA-binding NarL/FixJ family response regulator
VRHPEANLFSLRAAKPKQFFPRAFFGSMLSSVPRPRANSSETESVVARPKVLLADDHAGVLTIAVGLLKSDFDIVAAVPDGRQALERSLSFDPDVVVLDIMMPGLDGFQMLRELRRLGSRAKVVFLTLYHSDAYAAEAFNGGAQGYVLKTRIYSDLIDAIDNVLAGRLFASSLPSLFSIAEAGHTAQFHAGGDFFLDEASRFIGGALRSGDPIMVVAVDETRKGVAQRLKERGLDLAALAAQGRYLEQDSAEALSQIMRDGRPDADRVAGIVADLDRVRLSSIRGPKSRLTIFGDMAVLLCRHGDAKAVLELERIWDERTRQLPFYTVCSYPIDCFEHAPSRNIFPGVCAAHRAVSHAVNQ